MWWPELLASRQVMPYQDKRESATAPLPFSLSVLQIEATKHFGLSAQQVLDTCQRLYETHKLIIYPRSDCQYLPEEYFAERQECWPPSPVTSPN